MANIDRTPSLLRAAAVLILGATLSACAGLQPVEVQLEADDPAGRGPLECEATNAAGHWKFVAPGTVTVRVSSPLLITCKLPPGAVAGESRTVAALSDASREAARKGESAGAKVGGATGVALGVAAAPVAGPALILLLGAGGAMQGSLIGGASGSLSAGSGMLYPSPVVVRVTSAAPAQ